MTGASVASIVRGGTVVDGTGAPVVRADVRVRDGVIVEVGASLAVDGDTELDAGGAVVTPGFIDNHTHFDPSLFWDPFCDPMPQHGVTSVLIGNCSLSLAPMRAELQDGLSSVFSYIEDIPLPAFLDDVPWGWESYAEYRDATARGGLGVNVACLVGHTPLRLCVMGDAAWERAATVDERAQIAALLDDALRAGAFGMSTSFFDEDAASRPVPSRLADDDELGALFDVLSDHGGFVEFIPNLYSPSAKDEIEHIAALTGPRGITSTWNAVIYDDQRPQRGMRILDRAAELQAAGVSIHPQVSPRTLDAQVNWASSMAFMPLATTWHRFVHSDDAAKRTMLEDPEWRATARTEWDATQGSIFPVHRPDKVRFIVGDAARGSAVGRPDARRPRGDAARRAPLRRVRRLHARQRLRRRRGGGHRERRRRGRRRAPHPSRRARRRERRRCPPPDVLRVGRQHAAAHPARARPRRHDPRARGLAAHRPPSRAVRVPAAAA